MLGTFTGTGTSPTFKNEKILYSLVFAGTATVELQADIRGVDTWETVETYTATTPPKLWDGPAVNLRFNCTAYTNDVTWKVAT